MFFRLVIVLLPEVCLLTAAAIFLSGSDCPHTLLILCLQHCNLPHLPSGSAKLISSN